MQCYQPLQTPKHSVQEEGEKKLKKKKIADFQAALPNDKRNLKGTELPGILKPRQKRLSLHKASLASRSVSRYTTSSTELKMVSED